MAEATRHRQSSTSPSRSITNQPGADQRSNPDVFSDEYALDPIPVADGFRLNVNVDDSTTSNPLQSAATTRRFSTRQHNAPERNSSLLSRPDDPRLPRSRSPRVSLLSRQPSESTLDRSVSRASTSTMPRTQSLYQGATGPSHPYAMYTQDTFIRTPSTRWCKWCKSR